MAKTEIEHSDPGLFGKYRGKTIISEDGSYVSYGPGLLAGPTGQGKISPPEALRSNTAGGSGAAIPDGLGAALWLLLVPIGMIVLVICIVICPALWLAWRFLRKKRQKIESGESSFRGVGWIILALFMLVMGVCCSVATAFFFYTTLVPPHSGLLAFLMVLSWSLSLVIGGIDILRQNRAYTVLWVVGILAVLDILGMYLRPRNDYGQISTPQVSQTQNAVVRLATVFDPPSNIRSAPSTASSITCSIRTIRSIRILGTEGNWYKTDACDGQLGYINRRQIRF